MALGAHAGAFTIRLGRGPQLTNRRPTGGRQRRQGADICERDGRSPARCNHRNRHRPDRRAPTRDADIPIVFAVVSDPVGAGFVASLPRPGGNITGFISMEAGMASKWLELLTEIAPGIKRAAAMFNPDMSTGGGSYYLPAFEAAARPLKVSPIAAPVRSDAEIETVISSLGREPGGGLVLMPDSFNNVHRASIIAQSVRSNVPAVYYNNSFVKDGGLLSFGADRADLFRRSASYVHRILHGERPSELPVQVPVKFELAINLKTAKALGLTVPQSILLRADEVLE